LSNIVSHWEGFIADKAVGKLLGIELIQVFILLRFSNLF
jgi:hypothetical protein